MRAWRRFAVLLLSSPLLSIPTAVWAADLSPTAIPSFWAGAPGGGPARPGEAVELRAEVTGIPAGEVIVFEHVVANGSLPLGSGTVVMSDFLVNGEHVFFAQVTTDPFGEGTFLLRARYAGNAERAASEAHLELALSKATPDVTVTGPSQVHLGSVLSVQVTVATGGGPAPTGTVTLAEGGTVLATGSAPTVGANVSGLSAGIHVLTASYAGDGNYTAATSAEFHVSVVANTVKATGVGIQYTNFYPVIDGYRDTVALIGHRQETIAVSAKIYDANGAFVKSMSVAAGTGGYTMVWSGKSSTGAILPAGHYRIDQTLTDSAGLKKVYTSTVYLSWRKLVDQTVYVTQKGYDYVAEGTDGTGSVSFSNASGWARLSAGSNGWAAIGYEFLLPAAPVYRSIQFHVRSKGPRSVPPNEIGMQNFRLCARTADWDERCADKWLTIGNYPQSVAWFATSGSPSANRTGRYVRGFVSQNFGTTYVYNARVRVVYAVLK